jgi:hypothetical protein
MKARSETAQPNLFFFADQILKTGFVLGCPPGSWRIGENARGLRLSDTFAGIGLDGFGRRKWGWLAFRHGKDEYGIDSRSAKVPARSPGPWRIFAGAA